MKQSDRKESENRAVDIDTDGYRSYLLRCWRETGPAGAVTWRFRLQSVNGDEQRGFSDVRTLFEHVARLLFTELDGLDRGDAPAEEPPAEQGDQ